MSNGNFRQPLTIQIPNYQPYGTPMDSPDSIAEVCPAGLSLIEDAVDSDEFVEYGEEIMQQMRHIEVQTRPDPYYIERLQRNINWKMRKTLVVWLVQVHKEYALRQETLYLTINLIDRYCSARPVDRSKFQLLGITALWVAAKYEENHGKVPTIKNLSYMCCESYALKEFVIMEANILRVVKFELGHPTPEVFLKRLIRLNQSVFSRHDIRAVARYLMEITLVHRCFLNYLPSTIAQACILLADSIISGPNWKGSSQVESCCQDLYEALKDIPFDLSRKWADADYCCASSIVQKFLESGLQKRQNVQHMMQESGQLTPPKDSNMTFRWDNREIPKDIPTAAAYGHPENYLPPRPYVHIPTQKPLPYVYAPAAYQTHPDQYHH